MNTLGNNHFRLALTTQLSLLLVVAVFLWSIGAPLFFQRAHAANLTSVSDTLTTSNLSTNAAHTIVYTNATSTIAGQTIKIGLDPVTNAFTEAYSAATTSDISIKDNGTNIPIVAACGTNSVTVVGNYNNGTDENLTFTLCPSTTIAAGHTITIKVGTTTALWTNPTTQGSYRITIGGTQDNSGETRVAVLQNITLTASVNTSFTFTVTGLATSTTVNGDTTTGSTSPSTLPFSSAGHSLASGTAEVLAQQLNVSTNARNGFSVTVQENQPPTSSTGATIDLFKNGATTTTPVPWTSPTAILDVPSTYGHFGITSDDADEGGGEFVATTTTPYVGNIDQPRVVFSHTGPSDGTTQNKGKAKVGYKIQISDLQEAGNDYTNTITYVATPTF